MLIFIFHKIRLIQSNIGGSNFFRDGIFVNSGYPHVQSWLQFRSGNWGFGPGEEAGARKLRVRIFVVFVLFRPMGLLSGPYLFFFFFFCFWAFVGCKIMHFFFLFLFHFLGFIRRIIRKSIKINGYICTIQTNSQPNVFFLIKKIL